MLHPFPATLLVPRDPAVSRTEAAAWSRSLRDQAEQFRSLRDEAEQSRSLRTAGGRHQPGTGIPPDAFRRTTRSHLYRYEVSSPRGLVYQGMVGEVRLADLLPHEATLGTWAVKPTPPIEIRPLLAVGEAPLPDLAPAGPEVSVAYGSLVHRLTPLEAPVDGVATGTLVLADGHHRRQGALADLGPAATAMVLVVGSGGAGLRAEAFQRVFRGIGRLPGALERPFSIEPLSRVMPRVGALVWVYASGEGVVLRPRADALQALPAPLRRIGAAVAQHLLYPLLGVDDSDATHYSTTAGARHALAGDDGALLLPRVAVADVVAAARTGVLLPPKGSRFRPKPLRGLLLRDQPEIVDPNRAMIRS